MSQMSKEFNDEYSSRNEFSPIRSKIPANSKFATLEQLTDSSKPSKAEKKALDAYSELRKRFEDKDMQLVNKYYSYIAPLRRNLHREAENALSDLYVGKITFGQFNKKRKEISDEFMSKVDALNAERNANREAANRNNQKNAQKEATCTRLRAQLQQKMDAQNSLANGLADAQAWASGGVNGPTAALSARAAQKAQEQEQINQLQQYIINYCGGL